MADGHRCEPPPPAFILLSKQIGLTGNDGEIDLDQKEKKYQPRCHVDGDRSCLLASYYRWSTAAPWMVDANSPMHPAVAAESLRWGRALAAAAVLPVRLSPPHCLWSSPLNNCAGNRDGGVGAKPRRCSFSCVREAGLRTMGHVGVAVAITVHAGEEG
ncbi:hypothetical protein DAI22_07g157801 [Oryza sativa Japonica Group]|nr:hypothetical protein DAI22_07g157801 [Oryza sativa Japonica Group]